MNAPSLDVGLRRPALYNPSLWSNAEVRSYYVARTALLDRFVADLKREKVGTRPQHRLIVGQRGMGKSTLLRRIAVAVEDDAKLNAQWLPLTFPEEQYNVASLADFWLNCLDALGDQLEARGDGQAVAAIDAEVERLDRKDGEGALQALLRAAARLQRRLLLLVDNVDLVFDRIKKEDWAFREALQAHPELLLIGASSRVLEATFDYQAAFYDFFKIDELRGLSEDEMRETIINLAKLRGADEVIRRVESDPGRLRVLHTLTGGNPRTAVLLYGVLLKGNDGDVRSDLEGLLDEVTPLYKARFDELPPQSQQLVDKLALNWDPMTARQLADQLGWTVNLVSAQLDRLTTAGIVEKTRSGSAKRMLFQVAERFFNIWYLMRASRRVRRKLMWLVEFLRVFFSLDELQTIARRRLTGCPADAREAEYALALSRALGALPEARALETQALDTLLSVKEFGGIEEILDLRGEDRDLLPKAERIRIRKHVRNLLLPVFPGNKGGLFVEKLISLPIGSTALLEMVEAFNGKNTKDKKVLREFVHKMTDELTDWFGSAIYPKLGAAIASGEMADDGDVEGGDAAAVRYEYRPLAIIPRLKIFHYDKAKSSDAEQFARDVLSLDNSGVCYWFCLARALRSQQRAAEAEDACNRALAISTSFHVVYYELGKILESDSSRVIEAEQAYRKVTELAPERALGWEGLAMLLSVQDGRSKEASEAARKLCEIAPEDAGNQLLLAGSLLSAGETTDEQLAAARRTCELAPDSATALWILAISLYSHRCNDEAIEATCRWVRKFGAGDVPSTLISGFITLVAAAVADNRGGVLLQEFDAEEFGQRYRPIREALAAAVAGNAGLLSDVAPEVRKPALDILAVIAPELVKEHE
jgi:tetratricopeptide (TPR) repeat protein